MKKRTSNGLRLEFQVLANPAEIRSAEKRRIELSESRSDSDINGDTGASKSRLIKRSQTTFKKTTKFRPHKWGTDPGLAGKIDPPRLPGSSLTVFWKENRHIFYVSENGNIEAIGPDGKQRTVAEWQRDRHGLFLVPCDGSIDGLIEWQSISQNNRFLTDPIPMEFTDSVGEYRADKHVTDRRVYCALQAFLAVSRKFNRADFRADFEDRQRGREAGRPVRPVKLSHQKSHRIAIR